jgi:hypothetical protein
MKAKIEKFLWTLLEFSPIIIVLLLVVGFIILRTYCFFTYADTPVSELPAWVWWVMNLWRKSIGLPMG